MSDAYTVGGPRRPTSAPLVEKIRTTVDAWRDGGYPGASATSKRLLEHWFLDEHESAPGVPFRWYGCQREAVETMVYLYEVARQHTLGDLATHYASAPIPVAAQQFPRYVVKMATGAGKTKVMSLAVTWAYFHALREEGSTLSPTSLVIAPGLIVLDRLRDDFEHRRIWDTDPLLPPEWRADFDLTVCIRDEPVPETAPGVLLLTNVQALYSRAPAEPNNPVARMLGPVPPKDPQAADPPLRQIARRGRLLVLNDEAHHLHDEVRSDTGEPLRAIQVIADLHERAGVVAQLDFTATPRNVQGAIFPEVVSDYPLAQAIEDGIVKRPVIGELSGGPSVVTSDDAAVRYRAQLAAGVAKWREFDDQLAPSGQKTLLFVLAENTKAADQISAYLDTLADLSGRVLTIHTNLQGEVSTKELDQARKWAREVDRPDNPYAAVVSVLMLREGWDVRNVTVIVPLRALSAKNKILPEQALGRGLRRMTPPGSGVTETVVVIDHEAFRDFWQDTLADPEYDGIKLTPIGDTAPTAQVIAVEPERMAYDIGIPQLPRVITRSTGDVAQLQARDLPARELPLPGTLRDGVIDYTGRDLLTGTEVDRASYPLDRALDPGAVLAWFADEVQRQCRLTGQFAVIAALVRGYVEGRAFGGPVDFADPLVLQALAEPAAQETVLAVLREAIDRATLQELATATDEVKERLLSETRPFLWSGETAVVERSVFNLQPCDSGLEVRFCGFLDRCEDVAAFAKLGREVRFSLEFRGDGGHLAFYYPDFVVRLTDGRHLVVETKGLADLDVPHKDERAHRWCVDASSVTGTRWSYVRVDEDLLDQHAESLTSADALVAAAYARRREQVLASLGVPRAASAAEHLATMERVRERARGQDIDADAALRALREGAGE